MSHDLSISSIKQTFEDWAMYEAVIAHNYMFHNELARSLNAIAAAAAAEFDELQILDLGCGDSWLATHAFRNSLVAHYQGVDLSESAIERARGNTMFWNSRATVTAGNLVEFVAAQMAGSANFVLASNSLHHFLADRKAEIVQHCARILTIGGRLCWIDPVRFKDETRDGYLERLTQIMRRDWIGLSDEQRSRGIKHVLESDYPETASTMLGIAESSGFKIGDRFIENDLFGGWEFIKI